MRQQSRGCRSRLPGCIGRMKAMVKVLKEGDSAPAIHGQDEQAQPFDLGSLKGKNVVLYFFPKADTPG